MGMRTHFWTAAVTWMLLVTPTTGLGADGKKPVWSAEELDTEVAACTEALVKGAWENTKRAQDIDPKAELTPEIRKQLAPQIAAMQKVCDCAVREAAKKFGQGDSGKPEFQRFVVDSVTRGKCKPSE
jgi:hypothetical protein